MMMINLCLNSKEQELVRVMCIMNHFGFRSWMYLLQIRMMEQRFIGIGIMSTLSDTMCCSIFTASMATEAIATMHQR